MQSPASAAPATALEVALRETFGFPGLRAGQAAIIEAVLAGRDCLGIMPTGSGKSLCFQLPAVMRPGVTLVVSPLIALMQDQVAGLQARGVAATAINSSLGAAEIDDRLRRLGDYDLVYIAPERFRSPRFLAALRRAPVELFVIDEAHCVSMWGHDFRPDYLRMAERLPELGQPPILALTATATPEVREDIAEQLGLGQAPRDDPAVIVHGFARPNLRLGVVRVRGAQDKRRALLELLATDRPSGIIYCATRKRVEKVSALLEEAGHRCLAYHAGLADDVRRQTQQAFLRGAVDLVAATNAFGMGIDRADLRQIVHWDVPGSLEAYYQEAGRAGRDGDPAACTLLYNYADVRTQEFFIDVGNPPVEVVHRVAQAVSRRADPGQSIPRAVIRGAFTEQHDMAIDTALSLLEQIGFVRQERGAREVVPTGDPDALGRLDGPALARKERRDRSRLRNLLAYVDSRECRHEWILRHFGEETPEGAICRRCDNCERRAGTDGGARRSPDEAEWIEVQKVLSAVARTRGRFGRTRVTQILAGSKDQAVLAANLDQLPTYGALEHRPQSYIRGLIDALQDAGCIRTVGTEYPTIALTAEGRLVMRREAEVALEWPSRAPDPEPRAGSRGGAAPNPPEDVDPDLAEALRAWRLEQAQERSVPAYVIFSNRTLLALAADRPTTHEALLMVSGIGPKKAAQYGDAILEIVQRTAGRP